MAENKILVISCYPWSFQVLSVSHSKFPFLFFLFKLVPNFQGTYTEERGQEVRSGLWLPSELHCDLSRASASPVLCSCIHLHCCFLRINCYSMVYTNIEQPTLRSDFWWLVLSVIFTFWRQLEKLNSFHTLLWSHQNPKSLSRSNCLRNHKKP